MFDLSLPGVLGVDEDIYLTGGLDDGRESSKEVFVYITRSKQWRPLCQMNGARHSHVMVILEKIYVVGGGKNGGK